MPCEVSEASGAFSGREVAGAVWHAIKCVRGRRGEEEQNGILCSRVRTQGRDTRANAGGGRCMVHSQDVGAGTAIGDLNPEVHS
jgi:hypothetical protein